MNRLIIGLLLAVAPLSATPSHSDEVTRSVALADDWRYAVSKAENAVVQVVAQIAEFNWLQPYKTPNHLQGFGSGFIIDDEGHIITNYHVVAQAPSAYVYVPGLGGNYLEVSIVGRCPRQDTALLKLSDDSLRLLKKTLGKIPTLSFGDSDALYHTEPVLALGYPLGQRYLKSTAGEIAGREFIDGQVYMHITAPINPGNSGGPLLNKKGEVVGINTAGIRFSQNICYMMPSNDVKIIQDDLYTQPLVHKAHMGIWSNTSTQEHAEYLGNPTPAGFYVSHVETRSLAESFGLRKGDMIYQVNGYDVDHYGDVFVGWKCAPKVSLYELCLRFAVGERIELVVYRNGERLVMNGTIQIKELPSIRRIYPEVEPDEVDYELFGGMCVMQLRDNHFDYIKSIDLVKFAGSDNYDKKALLITNILPGSIIDKIGCLYAGCLLESVNGQKVETLAELRAALASSTKTGMIVIKTQQKTETVISLSKMLQDEGRLCKAFMVPMSDTVNQLMQQSK